MLSLVGLLSLMPLVLNTNPRQVATYVRSATHSWFGRVAVN
jgi:hypothetical protein